MGISGFPESENQGSGVGGFSYGGEWDATPTQIASVAVFNKPYNATLTTNQITEITSGIGFGATATSLSHSENTGTLHKFRVTVPDTTNGFFLAVVHNSSMQNPYDAINDETATVRGVGLMYGTLVSIIRDESTFATYSIPYTVDVGDMLKVGYRSETSSVFIYNETQGDTLLYGNNFLEGFTVGLENLSIFSMGAGTVLSFDFADEYFPIYQSVFSFDYPVNLAKTYYVSNASEFSIINGKLLKVGDFVNFFDNNGSIDVNVSRLVSDSYLTSYLASQVVTDDSSINSTIKTLIETELQNPASAIYQAAYAIVFQTISDQCLSTGLIDNAIQLALNP